MRDLSQGEIKYMSDGGEHHLALIMTPVDHELNEPYSIFKYCYMISPSSRSSHSRSCYDLKWKTPLGGENGLDLDHIKIQIQKSWRSQTIELSLCAAGFFNFFEW